MSTQDMSTQDKRNVVAMTDPPFAVSLFNSTRWAWLWLIVRLYIGYTWLSSGWSKISNPAWIQTGEALQGFWERAVIVPDAPARPAITYDWYRGFIQALLDGGHYTWFAKLVVAGELLIGVALVLGAFVGIAAFFGAFMNWNFMMAGSAGSNPVLFLLSILLVLAWKTAGWWGLDRWLLSKLGTPWRPGMVFAPEEEVVVSASSGQSV